MAVTAVQAWDPADGADNSRADSYSTRSKFVQYCEDNGNPIPDSTDEAVAANNVALRRAMIFIEGYGNRFTGTKKEATQPLQWPRTLALYADTRQSIPPNYIPHEIIKAQNEMAYLLLTEKGIHDNELMDPKSLIAEETIGPMRFKYNGIKDMTTVQKRFIMIEKILVSLLEAGDDRREYEGNSGYFAVANIAGNNNTINQPG